MNALYKGTAAVFKRELNLIRADRYIMTIILLAPFFYAFFLGTIFQNKLEHDVPVVIIDMDNSPMSRELARKLDATQVIKVSEVVPDFATAQDRIYSTAAYGAVLIPANYEASFKAGHGATLKVYLNSCRFLISNDINKSVNNVALSMGSQTRLQYFETKGNSLQQAQELIEPLRTDQRSLFNPIESYGDFLVPFILALILQQTLLMGMGQSIAGERGSHILPQWHSEANGSITAMIAGKALFYVLLFGAYSFFFFVVNYSLFNLNFVGSVSAMAFITLLFLMTVILLCIFFGSFFKSKILALQLFAFTSYPFFLVSGVSWPMFAMPKPLQWFAQLLPSTPYFNVIVRISQMGAGWGEVVPETIQLSVLFVVSFVLAFVRLKHLTSSQESKVPALQAH
jgi:ABC-2 type transport system permease protein